ncbi:hypothetical protein CASFOL_014830 [Castilleja foliolosa]|uniref:Uncharacterized protein n=1 Tax=Castilleja foliolosa TaxID=1961234 RepID=A0ABD3DDU1_9LAMI
MNTRLAKVKREIGEDMARKGASILMWSMKRPGLIMKASAAFCNEKMIKAGELGVDDILKNSRNRED